MRDVRNELDVEKGMLQELTDAVTGRSDEEERPADTRTSPRKASVGDCIEPVDGRPSGRPSTDGNRARVSFSDPGYADWKHNPSSERKGV